MEYRNMGNTGLKVSQLCLGAMNFGGPTPEKDAIELIRAFVDAGGNFIDTANVYSKGESEKIVGKALKGIRDKVVLATKVHGRMGPGPNDMGNSKVHILREVENSLRRLQTDYIDVYWIHRPDPDTPIEETLEALDYLVKKGYVRYVGSSTFPAWQIMEALWKSDAKNLVRFSAEQPPYNIIERQIEQRVVPLCEKYNIAIIPWSPLAGGWLSGKYKRGIKPPPDSRAARYPEWMSVDEANPLVKKRFDTIEKLEAIAKDLNCSLVELSIAWLLSKPFVTAPIIGPKNLEQLRSYLKSLNIEITDEVTGRIDEIVPPGTSLWLCQNENFVV
ncbi:MAG: aldo/keto reductase [Thermotogaceae bacterium]|nr:aldo/keto reductase [Thermotogaceae bacterium]